MSNLESLFKVLKHGIADTLAKYTVEQHRVVSTKEISMTLLAISFAVAKKTNLSYPKALAVIMVEASRYDRELAHAAIDDAFDDHERKKKGSTK